MTEEKSKNLKVKATAVIASISLLLNGALSQTGKLPDGIPADKMASPPAIQYTLPVLQDGNGNDDYLSPEENKKKKFSLLSWYSSKNLGVRLAISISFTFLCCLGFGVAYFSLSSLLPLFFKPIIRSFFLLLGGLTAYASITKVFLPQIPLRKILNWKVLLIGLLLASILSYGLEFILFSPLVHI